jgi:hypothetical protein
MTDDPNESLSLRPTVIAGQRYADDFGVIWRGLSIGRVLKAEGLPPHVQQWSWHCSLPGKPGGGNDTGDDLKACKQAFKEAWAGIRSGLTDAEIAHAHEVVETSRETLVRYQRRRPV